MGSERQLNQSFQDSMALCRLLLVPHLFGTMTANPKWREITEALFTFPDGSKQKAHDRPDIVARVFEQKKNAVLRDIKSGIVFGKVTGMVHTIEFQKRGLPHMHVLVWLDDNYKIQTPEEVDDMISAEIPDKDTDPELYELVTSFMLHGPCNQRCLVNGKCSKRFPKEFQEFTEFAENGYPAYRRRNNGANFTKGGKVYDNRLVFCFFLNG
jgi:Helitron helicase-like domain at N-terminus